MFNVRSQTGLLLILGVLAPESSPVAQTHVVPPPLASSPAPSATSTTVAPLLHLRGRITFPQHHPAANESLQLSFTWSGTDLFRSGENSCPPGDHHREAVQRIPITTDSDGRFDTSVPLKNAASVTSPQCTLAQDGATGIESLRLEAWLVASAANCESYCLGTDQSAPDACISTCGAGERFIEGAKTLSNSETQQLLSSGSSQQNLELVTLGPPLSEAPGVDLQVNNTDISDSITITNETFAEEDCAMVEGCVGGPGPRRLLRFDGNFWNSGTSDLAIGSPEGNPLFDYSACHDHFHLKNMMLYELLDPGTRRAVVSDGHAVIGRKQGFCVEDVNPVNPTTPDAKFDCDTQGLSSGWEDVYDRELDCQWLDVTGVPPGDYLLRVTVNPDGTFSESDTANNHTDIPVRIPR